MSRFRNLKTGVVVSVADNKDSRFASGWESYNGESVEATGYQDMKIADLKAELERRNAERDEDGQIQVEGTGKNGAVLGKDIAAALEADDAASDDDA
jgi:hypothetical protein